MCLDVQDLFLSLGRFVSLPDATHPLGVGALGVSDSCAGAAYDGSAMDTVLSVAIMFAQRANKQMDADNTEVVAAIDHLRSQMLARDLHRNSARLALLKPRCFNTDGSGDHVHVVSAAAGCSEQQRKEVHANVLGLTQ